MAKGITLKTKNGTKAYPKSVTNLIFDNATGKTLKQIIDELKAADSATDTRTQFYKASVTDLDALNAAANIGTYNYVGNGWRGLVQVCFDHSSNIAQVALSSSSPSYEGNVLSFIAAQPCAMARVYRNGAWSHWEKVGTSVVNDLTTGGTDKALSAEMGKTLKEGLDALGPEIVQETVVIDDLEFSIASNTYITQSLGVTLEVGAKYKLTLVTDGFESTDKWAYSDAIYLRDGSNNRTYLDSLLNITGGAAVGSNEYSCEFVAGHAYTSIVIICSSSYVISQDKVFSLSISKVESLKTITSRIQTAVDGKVDKTSIAQTTGSDTTKVMSQKAVTDIMTGMQLQVSAIPSLVEAVGYFRQTHDLSEGVSISAGAYVIPVRILSGSKFIIRVNGDSTKCSEISGLYTCDNTGGNRTALKYNASLNTDHEFTANSDVDYITFFVNGTYISDDTAISLFVTYGQTASVAANTNDISGIKDDISDIQDDISSLQSSAERIEDIAGETIDVKLEQGNYLYGSPQVVADRVRINRIIKKSELPIKIIVPNDINVRFYGHCLYSEDDNYESYVSWNSASSAHYKEVEFTTESLGDNNGLTFVFANSQSLSNNITPADCKGIVFLHKDGKIQKIEERLESLPTEEGNATYYGRKQTLKITDEHHKLSSELVIAHVHSDYPYTTYNQSMAVWNGKCFCFNDTAYASDGFCIVIDSATGEVLDRVLDVPTVVTANGDGKSHLNNACFTDQYYAADDEYPLLLLSRGDYASATNQNGKKMYVFRVVEDNGSFEFTLIKTIIADHNFLATFNPSWLYDAKRKMIWGYCFTQDWRWIDWKNNNYRKFKGVTALFKAYGASYVCVESGEQAAVSANVTIVVAGVSKTISVSQGDTISEVFAYSENAGGTCSIICSQTADAFTGLYYVYKCDANGDNKQLIKAQSAIVGFKAPDLCDGTTVTISNAEFTSPSYIDTGIFQGGCSSNGKLYLPYHDYHTINGNPTDFTGVVCLVVEPISGYIESMIYLSSQLEPEGCAIYNGELFISHHNGGATDETTTPSFQLYKYSFE